MELRKYQQEAVDAVAKYLAKHPRSPRHNPLVEVPTGGGKSAILGEICRVLAGKGAQIAVITHRAELISQDAKAIRSVWPEAPLAIYSAGLGRKEIAQITVAGVQSIARSISKLGVRHIAVIDEAHLVPTDESTQYGSVLAALRAKYAGLRVIGLTATPYRLDQGLLTEGDDAIFQSIVYKVPIKKLIAEGHLAPVVTGNTTAKIDTAGLSLAKTGDYVAKDLELASDVDAITERVATDVSAQIRNGRTSALVFGVSVAHVARLRNALQIQGVSCESITGDTDRGRRDQIIGALRTKQLQAVTSCEVLTTGFDVPCLDVVALVRPTMSPALYVQMVGRGTRPASGKQDCLLLDYGGNIARHGPIDQVVVKGKGKGGIAPTKICPSCDAEISASRRICEHCDHEFPPPELAPRKANADYSKLSALSDGSAPQLEVTHVSWSEHYKMSDPDAPPSLRIDYRCGSRKVSEWIGLQSQSVFARQIAATWWLQICGTSAAPNTVLEALDYLDKNPPRISYICVTKEGKYDRVIARYLSNNLEPKPIVEGGEIAHDRELMAEMELERMQRKLESKIAVDEVNEIWGKE